MSSEHSKYVENSMEINNLTLANVTLLKLTRLVVSVSCDSLQQFQRKTFKI